MEIHFGLSPVKGAYWRMQVADMKGKPFKLGQKVAKAIRTGYIDILEVTKIVDDKVYLGRGNNYLVYPHQVLIIEE